METEVQARQKRITKKERLLANPHVRRFFEEVENGSLTTAESWIQRLATFLERNQMSPMQLAEIDVKIAEILIHDVVQTMQKEGKKPQYIKGIVTTVKAYLNFSDVHIVKKFKIKNANTAPTLRTKKFPNGKELGGVLGRATLRQRAIISLIAKSGLRPQVLGDSKASDGLKIADLPELAIIGGSVTFTNNPSVIWVRPELSKNGRAYVTFMTAETSKAVIAYLNDRLFNGEMLTPESPVIAPSRMMRYKGNNSNKPFICTRIISKDARNALRPTLKIDPYTLRRLFENRLSNAEGDNKVSHEWRKYWAGHLVDIDAIYALHGLEIPKDTLEKMRRAFKECEPYLDIEVSESDVIEQKKQEAHSKIEQLDPEQLQKALELLERFGNNDSKGLSGQTKQNSSLVRVGSMSEPYQTEKSSSKNRVCLSQMSGPEGV